MQANHYQDSHLFVDFEKRTLRLDGEPRMLTRREFDLLAFLIRHKEQPVPREALMTRVWAYNQNVRTRTLDVHIRRLRKHLGPYGQQYIETIFGVGYRFQARRIHAPPEPAAGAAMAGGAQSAAAGGI